MEPKDKVIEAIAEEAGKNMGKEIIIRTGSALPQHEPVKIVINGTIKAPLKWLEKRHSTIDQLCCFVCVNRERMSIELIVDEKQFDGTYVRGQLELAPEFKRFGINNPEIRMTTFEMADLIKMNRTFFPVRNDAMVLVSQLRNFKAKVDKDIELADDRRGNMSMLRAQTVESNIPDSFKLNIPIFRGYAADEIEVEVDIDPNDLSCALVSPGAADIIETQRNEIIDGVLTQIQTLCPDIAIIEQ